MVHADVHLDSEMLHRGFVQHPAAACSDVDRILSMLFPTLRLNPGAESAIMPRTIWNRTTDNGRVPAREAARATPSADPEEVT